VHNPHDRLFRHVFSDPEHARGELAEILPAELSRQIDWSTLRLLPGSYVDAKLSELRSDVLFSVRLGGRQVLLYLLLEHQSSVDERMALRLLGYMVRIWEDHLRDHPEAELLPVIVPAVVYHGEHGWTQPLTMRALLDVDAAMAAELGRYVPDFEHRLDDLSSADAEELRARSMSAMAQLCLFCLSRARQAGDLTAELERGWQDRMRQVAETPDGVTALGTLLRYILEATETPPERVKRLVRQLGPRAEEAFMTGAQILRAEGEAKGRVEGRVEGRAEVLLRQLALKYGPVPEARVDRIRAASIEELDRWVEMVLTASSLDEALGS
jgi:predicted transposase/invertase (TIGR01784 family)